MGGQNARISKHSAAARVGGSISGEALWQLKVRSIWVARMQGFPSILRREVWEGAFQLEPYGGLGLGQYVWPECKDFQAFCGGKDGLEHFSCRVVQLRVRSVWVARMERFLSILRWEGWAGAFQLQGCGGLGSGQYGWPECKDFQAFCGGKDGLEHFSCRVVAA